MNSCSSPFPLSTVLCNVFLQVLSADAFAAFEEVGLDNEEEVTPAAVHIPMSTTSSLPPLSM